MKRREKISTKIISEISEAACLRWERRKENNKLSELNCVSFSISQHPPRAHKHSQVQFRRPKKKQRQRCLMMMKIFSLLWFMIIMRHEIWSCNNLLFRLISSCELPVSLTLGRAAQFWENDFFQFMWMGLSDDESGQFLVEFLFPAQLIHKKPKHHRVREIDDEFTWVEFVDYRVRLKEIERKNNNHTKIHFSCDGGDDALAADTVSHLNGARRYRIGRESSESEWICESFFIRSFFSF